MKTIYKALFNFLHPQTNPRIERSTVEHTRLRKTAYHTQLHFDNILK